MVKPRRELVNWLLALVTLTVLGVSVAMLFLIERGYRKEMRANVSLTGDAFARADVLRSPTDLKPNFAAIENLVAQTEAGSNMIRRVFVVKRLGAPPNTFRSVLVHPFYYAAMNPNWERDLPRLYPDAQEIRIGGDLAGILYFDLDKGPLRGVRFALALTAGLIVVILLALTVRIFGQERALTATTQILEENQRELIRMERLALAGLLSANILHDIRKPVTNIKHEIEDLSDALGGFAGASRALRNMREQVQLYFDILNELNIERFVRSDQADEEYVDVNRAIEQSLRLVHYERGSVQIHSSLASELPLVLAHPYRLVQVFSNLILNAFQALEGRGELYVTTLAGNEAAQGETPHPPRVIVEIADNGPGIPPRDIERIFTPFYSTKTAGKGAGLGLYICRTIVAQLRGTIRVESQPGRGARFVISLPAAE